MVIDSTGVDYSMSILYVEIVEKIKNLSTLFGK